MTSEIETPDLADQIAEYLPYLRRYARALTGVQSSGDQYAMATLEALLTDSTVIDGASSVKVGLFRAFHMIWVSSGAPVKAAETGREAKAQTYLSRLTANTREALLLMTVEGFGMHQVAEIMGIEQSEADELIAIARREMKDMTKGNILIIEDEAIIALDLESIVSEMGHKVTAVARTRDAAVRMGLASKPDLILADVHLADGSSGIDAVNQLLKDLGDIPVIFITAYPERLLTGDRPEPAFLIAKPYDEEQVASAVSQAMFFSSTETLSDA
jgi:CheY-like chemotaxis protein/DNA-directed RNA polymerase specialized sigma24 family protein